MKNPIIGVFDSGVGGLSVLRALWQELPGQSFIYLADQVHVPYGSRSLEQVRSFAEAITRYLLAQGVDLIVVACNTASAAALHWLRAAFPETLFVGMEPAVKPAAEQTRSGAVGVLATPATFQGALYASVVERFANGVQLHQHTCPGLVAQIEAGKVETVRTRAILEDALHPMLAEGIDTVVLGCTHYPFVIPLIEQIVGPGVRVIDPAPAVARQARRLLQIQDTPELRTIVEPILRTRILTTGDPGALTVVVKKLIEAEAVVERAIWGKDLIHG
jgi:glutamate racemase